MQDNSSRRNRRRRVKDDAPSQHRRLLIIGGGTAGTKVAIYLKQHFGKVWQDGDILLVDRENRMTLDLYWPLILSGTCTREECVPGFSEYLPTGIDSAAATVCSLDPTARHATIVGNNGNTARITYDFLVMATGLEPVATLPATPPDGAPPTVPSGSVSPTPVLLSRSSTVAVSPPPPPSGLAALATLASQSPSTGGPAGSAAAAAAGGVVTALYPIQMAADYAQQAIPAIARLIATVGPRFAPSTVSDVFTPLEGYHALVCPYSLAHVHVIRAHIMSIHERARLVLAPYTKGRAPRRSSDRDAAHADAPLAPGVVTIGGKPSPPPASASGAAAGAPLTSSFTYVAPGPDGLRMRPLSEIPRFHAVFAAPGGLVPNAGGVESAALLADDMWRGHADGVRGRIEMTYIDGGSLAAMPGADAVTRELAARGVNVLRGYEVEGVDVVTEPPALRGGKPKEPAATPAKGAAPQAAKGASEVVVRLDKSSAPAAAAAAAVGAAGGEDGAGGSSPWTYGRRTVSLTLRRTAPRDDAAPAPPGGWRFASEDASRLGSSLVFARVVDSAATTDTVTASTLQGGTRLPAPLAAGAAGAPPPAGGFLGALAGALRRGAPASRDRGRDRERIVLDGVDMFVWAPRFAPPALLRALPRSLVCADGRVAVDCETMQSADPAHPHVFAVGGCAAVPTAPTAAASAAQAAVAARNLTALANPDGASDGGWRYDGYTSVDVLAGASKAMRLEGRWASRPSSWRIAPTESPSDVSAPAPWSWDAAIAAGLGIAQVHPRSLLAWRSANAAAGGAKLVGGEAPTNPKVPPVSFVVGVPVVKVTSQASLSARRAELPVRRHILLRELWRSVTLPFTSARYALPPSVRQNALPALGDEWDVREWVGAGATVQSWNAIVSAMFRSKPA